MFRIKIKSAFLLDCCCCKEIRKTEENWEITVNSLDTGRNTNWVISEPLKWQNGDGGESKIFEMLRFKNIENIQFEVVRVKKYENKSSDFDSPSKSKFL